LIRDGLGVGSGYLNEALFFYPNLSSTGEYRSTFSLGLVTRLTKILSWQTSFNDYYQTADGEEGEWPAAINRALSELRRRCSMSL